MPLQKGLPGMGGDELRGGRRRPQDRPQFRPAPFVQRAVFVAPPGQEVALRRDYDIRQRIAPTHSPVDPPPQEDLEPRKVKPLREWLQELRGEAHGVGS